MLLGPIAFVGLIAALTGCAVLGRRSYRRIARVLRVWRAIRGGR